MKVTILLFVLLMLAGCATPITNNKGGIQLSATGTVGTDLLSAAYDFDNAIAIGVLPADDPGATCVHDVLQKTGIEVPEGTPAPQSFIPKNDGLASAGAILYIRAQQLRSLKGIDVSLECKALIGTLVVDGLHDARKAGGLAVRLLK